MGRRHQVAAALLLTAIAGCSPRYGAIPDKATAIRVGCAVIQERFPGPPKCSALDADLRGDTWTVAIKMPPGYVGSSPVVALSKSDGQLLNVTMQQ